MTTDTGRIAPFCGIITRALFAALLCGSCSSSSTTKPGGGNQPDAAATSTGGSTGTGGISATGGSTTGGSGGSGGSVGSATGGTIGSGTGGTPDAAAVADGSSSSGSDGSRAADGPASSGGTHPVTADNALVKCNQTGQYRLAGAPAADFCAFYEKYCPYDPNGTMTNNGKPLNATNGTEPWFYKSYEDCVMKYSMAPAGQQACRAGQLCGTNFNAKPLAQGCTHSTGHFDGACFK